MKLEVGKYYKTRDGRKAEWRYSGDPGNPMYPVKVKVEGQDFWLSYTADGGYWCDGEETSMDLIAEWTDDTGTLAELNAQVGDVVECVEAAYYNFTVGQRYSVEDFCGDPAIRYDDSGYCRTSVSRFRIVSRAKPTGPVITETVKRIVPGVYGHIWIDWVDGGTIYLGLRNNALKKMDTVGLSRADLIAARDVFNQLIDALEE